MNKIAQQLCISFHFRLYGVLLVDLLKSVIVFFFLRLRENQGFALINSIKKNTIFGVHIKTPDWFFVCEMLDGVDITFMTFIAVADVWQFHWIKLTEYR